MKQKQNECQYAGFLFLVILLLGIFQGSEININSPTISGDEMYADGHSLGARASAEKGWINGTITENATGKPIQGCLVEIINVGANTSSDAHGFYSIQVEANVSYDMRVIMEGYTSVNKSTILFSPGEGVWMNITLNRKIATIHAFFKSIGTAMALKGTMITVVNHSNEDVFKKVKDTWASDMQVIFQCEVPAPGTYDVIGEAPSYGTGEIRETIYVNPGDYVKVDLDVSTLAFSYSTLEIEINYRDETPAENVEITISGVLKGRKKEYIRYSDEEGRYEYQGTPGLYNITVWKYGYVKETKEVNLTSRNTSYVNFTLKKEKKTGDSQENSGWFNIVMIILIALAAVFSLASARYIMVKRKEEEDGGLREDEYICPKCGALLNGDAVVCSECGFKLPWKQFRCPECGTLLDYDAKRCGECGNTEFELK